ncbi:MAG: NTP transferase domain-containing protein [Traorella sp.]
MKAIVLAGGKGNKMFPFSSHRQKCTLPVGNQPNIKRIIHQLKNKVDEIVVILQHEAQDVISSLGKCNVRYVYSENLQQALISECQEDCLIYYGDIVVSEDVLDHILAYSGNCVLVQPTNEQLPTQDYLCAKVENAQVVDIYAHSRGTYANTRLCGIYKLTKEVLSYIDITPCGFHSINCGQMPDHDYHIENTMVFALNQNILIHAYSCHEVIDLDFPWNILDANQWYCKHYVQIMNKSNIDESAYISDKAIIRGNIKLGKNSKIGEHVIIKGNCEIGDNVIIEDGAIIYPNCVIGNDSKITDYCKISEYSVIGPKNKLGFSAEFGGVSFIGMAQVHGSEIYGVVGNYVDIGAGCVSGILKFDDTLVSQKVGYKRYANKNTNIVSIGDYTRTGICNVFYPGVKIGCHCALAPNLVIQQDIMDNQLVMPKQEVECKYWGSEKYGW